MKTQEDFYSALKPLQPKKKGKALRDGKHRTAQASYVLAYLILDDEEKKLIRN